MRSAAAAGHWVRAAELWEGRLDDDARAQAAYGRALAALPGDLSAWEGLARLAERRRAYKELEAAYRTFDASGSQTLRLTFEPREVLADGKPLVCRASVSGLPGWTFDTQRNVLVVDARARQVLILGR